MKKYLCLVLSLSIMLTALVAVSASASSVTIPADSTSKGGASVYKTSTGEPDVYFTSISRGSSIKFWVYKNGFRQVTPTYTFTETSATVAKHVYYLSEYASDITLNSQYHPVWKKAESSQNSNSVTIGYTFEP